MDTLETAENTWDLEEIEDQTHFNTIIPSFLQCFETQSVIPSEDLSPKQETIPQENELKQVEGVLKIGVNSHLRSILPKNSQLSNQYGKERTGIGFANLKLKLSFINQIAPTIFTNNKIKAKNGKPLLVAICDNTNNSNAIIKTGLLSSALVELVVLDGEFNFNRRPEKNNSWSGNDFNKSTVSERVGKRPLIVGNDKIIRLKNGLVELNDLIFTDNSSWTKTKKLRLGVKVVDKEILDNFPTIEEAVSEPFRVMDQRGEGYKKHHPPSREDEIWRLEGIGKNGAYHKRLSSNGIKTVGDFLKTYNKDSTYLKKLLGEKAPQKIWSKMISNALECDSMENEANLNNLEDGELYPQDFPSFNPTHRVVSPTHQHLGDNYEEMRGQGFEGMGEQDNYHFIFNDYPPLLSYGEASTSYNHNCKTKFTRF